MKFRNYLLIALLFLFAACSENQKPVDLTAAKKTDVKKIQMTAVSEEAFSTVAKLPGQLVPFNQVNLFPKVNGFVKEIFVDRGSLVKKGQLLLVLEAPEMVSQLENANAQLMQAKADAQASKEKYERLKEAAKEPGSVAPFDLNNAKARMEADDAKSQAQRSNVEAVKSMLAYLHIYAPFDGMIIQRNISPGALVEPGKSNEQAMLVLQDVHKMRLTVSIPEDYVDKVDLQKPVSFVFNALPGQTQTAHISRLANSLGSMQQEAIEIDVLNKSGQLKPGMYAEVQIPLLSGVKTLVVPNNAIVRSTEHEYVIENVDGKAKLVNIKEGLTNNNSTEVFGNLKVNDKVLLHATDEIKDGDKIADL